MTKMRSFRVTKNTSSVPASGRYNLPSAMPTPGTGTKSSCVEGKLPISVVNVTADT